MTFFKNAEIFLFLKFFWLGLVMGLVLLLVSLLNRLSRNNIYVYNLSTFCYCLSFGMVFAVTSLSLYNYSFCWFGFVAMIFGTILIKISIQFTFDKIIRLLYNRMVKSKKRKAKDGIT